MKTKCPKCNSDDYNLGDYHSHMAYDDVVDAIGSDGVFSVLAECEKCGALYWINFEVTSIEEKK